jgi:hypothetical protein
MLERLRRNQGRAFTAIGVAHVAVIGIQYRREWRDLFASGFVNQVDEQGKPYQAQGYWSFFLGPVLIATGQLAQAQIDRTGRTPRSFNAVLAATSIAGGIAMPVNGLWSIAFMSLVGLTGQPDDHPPHPEIPAP